MLAIHVQGLAALWRGNLATIIHRLPYSATNFAVFEAANKVRLRAVLLNCESMVAHLSRGRLRHFAHMVGHKAMQW